MPPVRPRSESFWRHVRTGSGCWEWTGATDRAGYGVFRIDGRKMTRAHRYSFTLNVGPIPEGLEICHRCDNPPCVRPDHLFTGTALQNRHDAMAKGRHPHGDSHGRRRIDATSARAIRERFAVGGLTYQAAADELGVTIATAHRILRGRTWREAGGPIAAPARHGKG